MQAFRPHSSPIEYESAYSQDSQMISKHMKEVGFFLVWFGFWFVCFGHIHGMQSSYARDGTCAAAVTAVTRATAMTQDPHLPEPQGNSKSFVTLRIIAYSKIIVSCALFWKLD